MDFFKTGLLEKNIKSKRICLLAGALALSFSLAHAAENIDRATGYNNPSNAVSIKELDNSSKVSSYENKNDFKSSKKYKTDISEQILQKPEDKTSMERFKAFCYRNKYAITIAAVSVIAMIAILYKFGPKLKEKFNDWRNKKKDVAQKDSKDGKGGDKTKEDTEQGKENAIGKEPTSVATPNQATPTQANAVSSAPSNPTGSQQNPPALVAAPTQANAVNSAQSNPTGAQQNPPALVAAPTQANTVAKNENTGSNNTPATTPIKKKDLDEENQDDHNEAVSTGKERQTPTSEPTTAPKPKGKNVVNKQQGNGNNQSSNNAGVLTTPAPAPDLDAEDKPTPAVDEPVTTANPVTDPDKDEPVTTANPVTDPDIKPPVDGPNADKDGKGDSNTDGSGSPEEQQPKKE